MRTRALLRASAFSIAIAVAALPPLAYAARTSFLNGLASEESGGNASATSPYSTSVGQYQMTEAALQDTGFGTQTGAVTASNYNGNLSNFTFSGKDGVTSVQSFLSNPAAQQAAAGAYSQHLWNDLSSSGVANQYLGKTVNGQVMNQSGMLMGAYLLGSQGMSNYLKNGGVVLNPDGSVNQTMTRLAAQRIAAGSQLDSSSITGNDTVVADSQSGVGQAPGAYSATSVASTMYCSPTVAKMLVEGAANYIQRVKNLATDPKTGYTLLNGNSVAQAAGVSPGASTVGGSTGTFGEFSCLSNLMGGNLNMLFEPPNLSSVLQQMVSSVCSAADSELTSLAQPISSAISQNYSLGGFFPGANISAGTSASLGGGNGFSIGSNVNPKNILSGNGGNTGWYTSTNPIPAGTSYFKGLLGGTSI